MSINFAATSDPYKETAQIGTVAILDTSPESFDCTFNGVINAVHDDPDVQEIYLRETSSPWRRIKLDGFQIVGGNWGLDHEFSSDPRPRSAFTLYVLSFPSMLDVGGTYSQAWGRYETTSQTGAETFGIALQSGYHWAEKDPAQIISSMAQYYPATTYGTYGLRTLIDQTSFEDASDDFDDHAPAGFTGGTYTNLPLNVIREVGKSLKEQIEDIIEQTVDWLGVRPDSSGVAKLHYFRRDIANQVTTTLDFDDPDAGVARWLGGVDDNLTIDELEFTYGHVITALDDLASRDGTWHNSLDNYQPQFSSPPDLEHEEYRFSHVRRHDGRVQQVRCENYPHRWAVERHWHIYQWAWEQQDLTFDQGPLHFNYEIGDVITIKSAKLGLVGTETFVVYEKDVDYDTLHATVRVLRVYGFHGTRPDRLAQGRTLSVWHRSEQLAGQPHDALAHVPTATFQPKTPRDERWLDASGPDVANAFAASGAAGTAEVLRKDDADALNEWPTLDMRDGAADQFEHDYNETSSQPRSMMFCVRHDTGSYAAADQYLWLSTNGASGDFAILLHDTSLGESSVQAAGTYYGGGGGEQALSDALWHTLIVVAGANAAWYESNTAISASVMQTIAFYAAAVDQAASVSYLGSADGAGSLSADVLLTEFAIFENDELSSGERDELNLYLLEKYRFDQ